MSRFELKTKTVTVRDQNVVVRELTQAERSEFVKQVTDDKFRAPALLVSLASTDPKMTEAEAAEEPAEVITLLASEIMTLSGMDAEEPKKKT